MRNIIVIVGLLAIITGFELKPELSLHNSDIYALASIDYVNDSLAKIHVKIKNISSYTIYMAPSYNSEQLLSNYIGIGVFSNMYPALPGGEYYSKGLRLPKISPDSSINIDGKIRITKKEITFRIDYLSTKYYELKVKDTIIIKGGIYDKVSKYMEGQMSW